MDLRDFNRYRMSAGGWTKLFERADIDPPYVEKYAKHFVDHKIRLCDVERLNRECFLALEVNFIGDAMAIQRIAAEIIKAMDEQRNDGFAVDSSRTETSSKAKRVEPVSTATTSSPAKRPSASTLALTRKRRHREVEEEDEEEDGRSPPAVVSTIPEAVAVAVAAAAKARATSTSAEKLKPVASRLQLKSQLKKSAAVPDKRYSFQEVGSESDNEDRARDQDEEDEEEEEEKEEEEEVVQEKEEVNETKRKRIKLSDKEKEQTRLKFGGDFKITREIKNDVAIKRPDAVDSSKPELIKIGILTDSLLSYVKLGSVRYLKPGRERTPVDRAYERRDYGEYFDRLEIKQFSYTGLKAFAGGLPGEEDRAVVYEQMTKEYPNVNDRPKYWFVLIGVNDLRTIRSQFTSGMKCDFLRFFERLRQFAPGCKIKWIGVGGLADYHERKPVMDDCRRRLSATQDFPAWLEFEDLCHGDTTYDFKDEWGHFMPSFTQVVAGRLVERIKEVAKKAFERKPVVVERKMGSVEQSIAMAIASSKPGPSDVRKRIKMEPSGGMSKASSSTLKSLVVSRRKVDGPAITIAPSVKTAAKFVKVNGKTIRRPMAAEEDEEEEQEDESRKFAEYGPRLPSRVEVKTERSESLADKKPSIKDRLGWPKVDTSSGGSERGKRQRIEWKP